MIWAIISILLSLFLFYFILKHVEWKIKFEERIRNEIEKREREVRADAIKRSTRTIIGKTLEKLVPFMKNFPYDAQDIRWIGDPIDWIIFNGYASGKLNKIIFCEIKSGESKLTPLQKKIKDIVKKKKVEWNEIKIS
jgi:predicted Holliday junction resolvase-like endonuclease